jgi:hypothetical protein
VAVAIRIAQRTGVLLEQRGYGPDADPDQVDSLAQDDPLLASLYSASIAGRNRHGSPRRAARPRRRRH